MISKLRLLSCVFCLWSSAAFSNSSLELSPEYISGLTCNSLDSIVYDIFDNDRLQDSKVQLIANVLLEELKEKECSTIAQALNLNGFQYYVKNDIVTAREFLLEAELLSKDSADLQGVYAHNQIFLGLTHCTELHFNVGKLYFERARDSYASIDNKIGVIDALQNIGLASLEEGHLLEAVESLQQADAICKQEKACTQLGYIQLNLSRVFLQLENTKEAIKYLNKADSTWSERKFYQGLFFVAMSRASIYKAQDDNKNQILYLKKAIDISDRHQLRIKKHEPFKRLGEIYQSLDQEDIANEYYVEALNYSIDMFEGDLEEISNKVINYYERNKDETELIQIYERLVGYYKERELIAKSKADMFYKVEKSINQTENKNSELKITNSDIQSRLNTSTSVLALLSLVLGLISILLIVIYSENKKRKALLQQVELQNLELNTINNQLAKSTQTISTQNKQLEIQNESLKNFASIASHDLKSPARTIKNFVGLLRKKLGAQLDASTSSILDVIDQTSHNMYDLIQDILNFSMVEHNAVKICACKITDVLGDVLSDMSNDIAENNINIEIRKMPSSIQADKSKLKQLFANLISNAIKYRHQERNCEISVSYKENDLFHSFTVSDNGIGIEKDFQEKVFIMFEKRTSNKNIISSGIGLAICKKIAEIHKGTISVKSVEGVGSDFSFTIAKDMFAIEKQEC